MIFLLRIFFSIFIFIILTPIILLIGLIIRIESEGPAIHISKRIGQNNNIFNLYKFRTMRIDTPQIATHIMNKSSKSYTTFFGKFLRKYSFDELPQIINILKGDMVFVGPRPALYNQEDLVKMRTMKGIEKLKPGITGLAQINGRDEISIKEKVNLDYKYLKERSLFLDIKIIFLTFFKVISGEDVKL